MPHPASQRTPEQRPGATSRAGLPARPGRDPAAGVLRLQRAAGNRAVRALLREPTALADLDVSARGKIQTATAPIPLDAVTLEDFGGSTTALPTDTKVVFGATVPTDAKFRKGLASTAADFLNRSYTNDDPDAAPTNFRENSTIKFEFDFTKQKGAKGVWQFTYIKLAGSGGHELLIEYLGTASSFAAPSNEADRVKTLGWTISGYSEEERGFVLAAIGLLSDKVVAKLPAGLKFARQPTPTALDGCSKAPDFASGDYCKPAKTISMYDRWAEATMVEFAHATNRIRAVLHEIGHAIDLNNPAKHAAFNTAVTQDGGTPVSGYAKKSTLESYAECFSVFIADPDLLKALRPHVNDYFTALFA
jgi:hypothetical protein